MSDKTNEEKLKILRDRLASIQEKEEIKQEERIQEKKPIAPVLEEELVSEQKLHTTPSKRKGSTWKLIFFIIIGFFTGYLGYHLYSNDFKIDSTIENIKEDFDTISEKTLSLFGEDEDKNNKKNKKNKKNKDLIYDKSEFNGKEYIIVLSTFDKQEPANKERDKLTEKGYNCGVYLLASVSNSEEEVFQTYIGPFNTEAEANQYLKASKFNSRGNVIKLQ